MVKTTWVQKHRPLTLKCDVNLVPDSDDQFTVEWRKDYKLIFSAHGTQDSGHTLEAMQGKLNSIFSKLNYHTKYVIRNAKRT
uniref:Ig-like domain-containing protein n=1 Tax=Rhabditophanes sp. KR3021 TaxID=114890 RepID=A0AC35U5S8_9BILA